MQVSLEFLEDGVMAAILSEAKCQRREWMIMLIGGASAGRRRRGRTRGVKVAGGRFGLLYERSNLGSGGEGEVHLNQPQDSGTKSKMEKFGWFTVASLGKIPHVSS